MSEALSKEQLDHLEELANKATPGRRRLTATGIGNRSYPDTLETEDGTPLIMPQDEQGGESWSNDNDARLWEALDPHIVTTLVSQARKALNAGKPDPCVMTHTPPYDFAQCETHDTTFALGETCEWYGVESVAIKLENDVDNQRLRAVKAEMERDSLLYLVESLPHQVATMVTESLFEPSPHLNADQNDANRSALWVRVRDAISSMNITGE